MPFTEQQSLMKQWHWHIRQQQWELMTKTLEAYQHYPYP